jgi:hypothetical protein
MTIFDKAWAVLKELEEGEMHAPGTCPVCDKKRAMQEGQ